jgi:hypothetical protein
MDCLASIFESKIREVMTMKDDYPMSTEPAQFKQDKAHTFPVPKSPVRIVVDTEWLIEIRTAAAELLDTCYSKGMWHHADCKALREALAK